MGGSVAVKMLKKSEKPSTSSETTLATKKLTAAQIKDKDKRTKAIESVAKTILKKKKADFKKKQATKAKQAKAAANAKEDVAPKGADSGADDSDDEFDEDCSLLNF